MSSSSEKYEIKKEQIIEAAEDLFAYYGYDKTTLSDIADKIGIKKNSIYYYFDSKEQLLNEIISDIFKTKVDLFEEKSAGKTKVLEKLKIFLSVLIDHNFRDKNKPNVTPNAFLEISRVIDHSFQEFYLEAEKILNSILKEGIKNGELRKHKSLEVSKTILGFARALEHYEYTKSITQFIDKQMQKELEKRVLHFVDLIYHGIKK